MKVKELKEKLADIPDDLDVVICKGFIGYSNIRHVAMGQLAERFKAELRLQGKTQLVIREETSKI